MKWLAQYSENQKQWFLTGFLFLAALIVRAMLGIHFDAAPLFWFAQYLDLDLLRNDLLRSLYYMHHQPPLFNFFIGIVLKLFPDHVAAAFAVAFYSMVAVLLRLLVAIMRKLSISWPVTCVLTTVYAIHPCLTMYANWLVYTIPVATLLMIGVYALLRYCESNRKVFIHLFFWSLCLVVFVRASYHQVWFLAIIASTLYGAPARFRKQVLLAALLPLVAINALYLKNYTLVGVYGGGSQLGMNIQRCWTWDFIHFISKDEIHGLVADKTVRPAWALGSFLSPDAYKPFGYFPEHAPFIHPAIDGLEKKVGSNVNFNHREYAHIAKDFLSDTLRVIRKYPRRYLWRTGVAIGAYLEPGPGTVYEQMRGNDLKTSWAYRQLWNKIIFMGGPLHHPIKYGGTLALFCFLGFLCAQNSKSRLLPLYLFFLITFVYHFSTSVLLEIGENERMRAEIDPILLIGVALLFVHVYAFWKRRGFVAKRGR